jgi:signal transduction histidine kinase
MMRRLGLRPRMAASYVLVTAGAVLVVEAVLLGLLVPRVLSGSDLQQRAQYQAATDAKTFSLLATKLSSTLGTADDRRVLAEAASKGVRDTPIGQPVAPDARGVKIPYRSDRAETAAEVLLDVNGLVMASSSSAYLPGDRIPVRWDLVKGGVGVADTKRGKVTWAVSPVVTASSPAAAGGQPMLGDKASGDNEPGKSAPAPEPLGGRDPGLRTIGMLYVQVPQSEAKGRALATFQPMLIAGAAVLALVVPVGVLFGLLSTGRVIRRLRRLADATVAVAHGDFRPRVPVEGTDEIGRLEDSLNRMAERLADALDTDRRLAGSQARQAERARIARELHDSISQDLFSISLLAAGLRRALPQASALRPEAEAMERAAARTMREMQALLLELRPVALEDAGLRPALAELCHAYEARLGIAVRAELGEVTLAAPAEHAVLRVVQEALGNAVRHGGPDLVRIRLAADDGMVGVEVCDDGDGFDPDGVADRHGMGLALMRERVEELGGRFTIVSRPGSGTTVRAWLPAAATPDAESTSAEAGSAEGAAAEAAGVEGAGAEVVSADVAGAAGRPAAGVTTEPS